LLFVAQLRPDPKITKISAHFDSPFAVFAVALIAQAIAA
jgi:hypothetical protein